MEVVKNIAAIVGCVLSCLSLLTIIIRPLRKGAINWVANIAEKSETNDAIADLKNEMNDIKKKIEDSAAESRKHYQELQAKIDSITNTEKKSNKALKDIIRESIVNIYYSNLPKKQLHYEEWETVSELSKSYFDLDGNHFVKGLVDQMSHWEIIQ